MAKKKSRNSSVHHKASTVEDVERLEAESPAAAVAAEAAKETAKEQKAHKIHLDFYGSELLRSRLPKTFELAEAVADDWVNDRSFENLPIEQPLAQFAAGAGLRKAKEIEKKLDEKGVFLLARTGLEIAKSKLPRRSL